MCAAVTVAALIDHEGTRIDFDLIRAEVVDHLGAIDGCGHAAFGHGADIHRANTCRGGVQDQNLGAGFGGELLNLGHHGQSVCLTQGALPHDDDRCLVRNVMGVCHRGVQRSAVGADVFVIIGQIRSGADQPHIGTLQPGLADTGVQNRRFVARVGADQQDRLRHIDILNRRSAHIGRAVANGEAGIVGAAFHRTAQTFDELFQGKGRLDRDQIADQTGNFLALHGRCHGVQRLGPCGGAQFAINAHIGLVQTLATQTVPDEPGLVRNPLFVHAVVVARQDPHHFAALGVHADVRAKRVHHVDGFGLGQLPGAGGKRIGFRGQRTNRAKIDDIALQVRIQRLVQVGGDLRIFAATGLTHLSDAGDFSGETHAAGAGNAAGHGGADQRSQIQIIHGTLGFTEAGEVDAIGHRLILQVAFAALVTDRAIERVVDQEELHHAFARLLHHR